MSEQRVIGIIVCSEDVTAEHGRLLQQQGIPILAGFNAPNGQLNGGEANSDYFVDLPIPPTAMVCFHDLMAIGLLHMIRESTAPQKFRSQSHCIWKLHRACQCIAEIRGHEPTIFR